MPSQKLIRSTFEQFASILEDRDEAAKRTMSALGISSDQLAKALTDPKEIRQKVLDFLADSPEFETLRQMAESHGFQLDLKLKSIGNAASATRRGTVRYEWDTQNEYPSFKRSGRWAGTILRHRDGEWVVLKEGRLVGRGTSANEAANDALDNLGGSGKVSAAEVFHPEYERD